MGISMVLIKDWFDVLCIVLGVIGIGLIVYDLYLYDWEIDKALYKEEK